MGPERHRTDRDGEDRERGVAGGAETERLRDRARKRFRHRDIGGRRETERDVEGGDRHLKRHR